MGEMIEATSPSELVPESAQSSLEEAKITVKAKWQGAVNEGSGFVAVPMSLLRLQSRYNLNPTDMLVLINLLAHWWDPSQPVYPRSTTIAKRNTRNARAGGKGFFQNAPPLLQTPMAATFRSAENRDPAHNNRS